MRFLITGAAGFLGSALANHLVRGGHMVRGVDDLSTGDPSVLLPEVQFTRGDVNDRPKLWTLLQDVDCVYHLAARVLVPESVLYPREYDQVNVGGTVTLMEALRDVGVRRVVLISSGAVYGNQTNQPVREDAMPNPRSPYAVSKLAAEYYVRTIGALWGIETVCLRVFNAYGPGQHMPPVHAPVIPYFIRQSIQNGTIVIHGDGKQTRDYVYVDDVVAAMTSAATASSVNQMVINVGGGAETSVRDLANLVMQVTGGQPEVITNPRNDGGPARLWADLTLARQKLDYEPDISLETGLRLTLERDPRFQR
ncbi:MAG TPA: NAD-dependent epimerase/dehydratase family protein, partial [Anaerolineaceae bacterium]|nr:NAD-dependent epimerase/dehydratase family protein [Anaerolineaceae bacterium]HQF45057.1 NAD-dependent epimerase/dehydratase family protein [Anaerolineaceae bacterium]HQO96959.1 NAD-dependent epimerase/dehydratase family protein [Anaerolineaceae bacterium]HQP60327.1 NAD-dependent epimerase/dehydratase family protein [Anaerolineaceae bacterium]